jgi:hypothetical protein
MYQQQSLPKFTNIQLKGTTMRCFENSRFHDYDNRTTFLELARSLESEGFDDVTYGNDVCPSIAFGHYEEAHIELKVFVDYADPAKRESEGDIFTIVITSDHPDVREEFVASTDSIERAIDHAKTAKQSLVAKLEDQFYLFQR